MSLHLQHRGFTLVELLIVISIMGLLGTFSVSAFRGLKVGMEERGVMQNVDEFVRSAYRRAVIDRVPTAIYLWNETISDETIGDKVVVVGRAVAVRRAGRLSRIDGNYLVDEFGDLAYETYTDEDGNEDTGKTDDSTDQGRYLYKVGDTTFARSIVAPSTMRRAVKEYLMSRPDKTPNPEIRAYAYYLKDAGGITWKTGDSYGFEFAELTLPKNYIFGANYSTSAKDPERSDKVVVYNPSGSIKGGNVTVSGLKLDKQGAVSFKSIGTSADPTQKRK